jgi:hypothetical protein
MFQNAPLTWRLKAARSLSLMVASVLCQPGCWQQHVAQSCTGVQSALETYIPNPVSTLLFLCLLTSCYALWKLLRASIHHQRRKLVWELWSLHTRSLPTLPAEPTQVAVGRNLPVMHSSTLTHCGENTQVVRCRPLNRKRWKMGGSRSYRWMLAGSVRIKTPSQTLLEPPKKCSRSQVYDWNTAQIQIFNVAKTHRPVRSAGLQWHPLCLWADWHWCATF